DAYVADPTKETFNQLAWNMITDKKGADLEALLAAHRPRAGDDADVLFFAARAKVFTRQSAQATLLFKQAYDKQTLPHQRTEYVRNFILDMAEAGLGLEAYRAAPEKPMAFHSLANRLVYQKKQLDL